MEYILRSTNTNVVNLPSEVWTDAGWNINDKLEVILSEIYTGQGIKTHYTLSIERIEDIEKYGELDDVKENNSKKTF